MTREQLEKPKIALKPCRHCAFTKNHLGTKEVVRESIEILNQRGAILACHEYSEYVLCASHCAKKKIKGERQKAKGDLYLKYAYITKDQKDNCALLPHKKEAI